MNRPEFYTRLHGSLFPRGLSQSQVDTIEAVLDEATRRSTPRDHLAYLLATARHEPGDSMVPNEENLWYTRAARIRAVSRTASTTAAWATASDPTTDGPSAPDAGGGAVDDHRHAGDDRHRLEMLTGQIAFAWIVSITFFVGSSWGSKAKGATIANKLPRE